MRGMKAALLGALALTAAGCAGLDRPGAFRGTTENYAAGSALGAALGGGEQRALADVFRSAMERAPGERADWSSGGFRGAVTPGRYLVGNLKPDPQTRLAVDPAVDLSENYETELGLHAVKGTANLRAGPSTSAPILAELTGGEGVDGVGRVIGKPWILIAREARVAGYVHDSLLVRAPGDELVLAGGPTRRAWRCREFSQALSGGGRSDNWSGVACNRGEGWRLEADPREELLGY